MFPCAFFVHTSQPPQPISPISTAKPWISWWSRIPTPFLCPRRARSSAASGASGMHAGKLRRKPLIKHVAKLRNETGRLCGRGSRGAVVPLLATMGDELSYDWGRLSASSVTLRCDIAKTKGARSELPTKNPLETHKSEINQLSTGGVGEQISQVST